MMTEFSFLHELMYPFKREALVRGFKLCTYGNPIKTCVGLQYVSSFCYGKYRKILSE